MADLISVTSFTNPSQAINGQGDGTTASVRLLNPKYILSVKTRATAWNTTGITDIVYAWPVNEATTQVTFIVTQTAAAVLALANASVSTGSSGRATLVAGTVTVSVPGLTSANNVVVSLLTANTTTLTTEYQAVAGTDSIVIRANVAAGTINVADVSTLVYAVVG